MDACKSHFFLVLPPPHPRWPQGPLWKWSTRKHLKLFHKYLNSSQVQICSLLRAFILEASAKVAATFTQPNRRFQGMNPHADADIPRTSDTRRPCPTSTDRSGTLSTKQRGDADANAASSERGAKHGGEELRCIHFTGRGRLSTLNPPHTPRPPVHTSKRSRNYHKVFHGGMTDDSSSGYRTL